MEDLTINLTQNTEDNLDKLNLFLMLCEAKLEKDITIPIKRVTIIGQELLDENPNRKLRQIFSVYRKIGVAFTFQNKHTFEAENDLKHRFQSLIAAKCLARLSEVSPPIQKR